MTSRTRILASAALLPLACGIAACGGSTANDARAANVVNVFNWADYIAPDTLDKFEAEFGIEVNYDLYDSSEVADVKLLTGNSGYDVVVHSNQFSSRLAPIGVFEKLDWSKLPNSKNLDPELMQTIDVYETVTDYNVPYHWGTTGYAWNVEMVRARLPDHPMDSADVLFEPAVVSQLADCGVTLLDGPTDVIPMVLAYLGRDPSAVDDESLLLAQEQLISVRPYIRYFSNQKMLSDLPNREVCVAMSWSGDYAQAESRAAEVGLDIELRYTIPKEGAGLWVDGLYIPADAPHRENAYTFLNFLLRPEIAAAIVNEVRYANSNRASWAFVRPEILNNPAIYPDEEVWERLYPIVTVDPKFERPRTRAFVRGKSGI
ncbi:MAG: polyamine ABC transporter substrate-binding protein [Woeseiaceae bacterium]|nr:polyamine ABC transporter substrate-binding protein [Woeseiaceae bacterium]